MSAGTESPDIVRNEGKSGGNALREDDQLLDFAWCEHRVAAARRLLHDTALARERVALGRRGLRQQGGFAGTRVDQQPLRRRAVHDSAHTLVHGDRQKVLVAVLDVRGEQHARLLRCERSLHHDRREHVLGRLHVRLAPRVGSVAERRSPGLADRREHVVVAADHVRNRLVEARAGEAGEVLDVGVAAHEDAVVRVVAEVLLEVRTQLRLELRSRAPRGGPSPGGVQGTRRRGASSRLPMRGRSRRTASSSNSRPKDRQARSADRARGGMRRTGSRSHPGRRRRTRT